MTLYLIRSSRFFDYFSYISCNASLRSRSSYSSFNFSSRTSLLLVSSSALLSIKLVPVCFSVSTFFSYFILILRSSFLCFYLVIKSVTFLPDILSSSSMLYLSIFLLSFRRSWIAPLMISRVVLSSLILFSAKVISFFILLWSYFSYIVASFCLLRRLGSLFLSYSSSSFAYSISHYSER